MLAGACRAATDVSADIAVGHSGDRRVAVGDRGLKARTGQLHDRSQQFREGCAALEPVGHIHDPVVVLSQSFGLVGRNRQRLEAVKQV
jgi:hypothetical protein